MRAMDLPPVAGRMTYLRKAQILDAIQVGALTVTVACTRYDITPEELDAWAQAKATHGHRGLRVTRLQVYQPQRRQRRRPLT